MPSPDASNNSILRSLGVMKTSLAELRERDLERGIIDEEQKGLESVLSRQERPHAKCATVSKSRNRGKRPVRKVRPKTSASRKVRFQKSSRSSDEWSDDHWEEVLKDIDEVREEIKGHYKDSSPSRRHQKSPKPSLILPASPVEEPLPPPPNKNSINTPPPKSRKEIRIPAGMFPATDPRTKYEKMNKISASALKSHDFEDRVQKLYTGQVIYTTSHAAGASSITVNLASLHRARLHYMRRKLVLEALGFRYEKQGKGYWFGTSIHEYGKRRLETPAELNWTLDRLIKDPVIVQALQDHEYMKECSLKGINNDPFLVSTTKAHERILLQEAAREWREGAENERKMFVDKDRYRIRDFEEDMKRASVIELGETMDDTELDLFGGSRNAMNKKEALERFAQKVMMACIGGAFFIGPMLIMVLHQSRLTALLTASICVFAFGLVMAFFLEKQFDVLSTTAAYAAVIVVFVGTSTGSAGNGD
jgi:hypothetical protein